MIAFILIVLAVVLAVVAAWRLHVFQKPEPPLPPWVPGPRDPAPPVEAPKPAPKKPDFG